METSFIRRDASLFAYVCDSKRMNDIMLKAYVCSGKFDKNSMARWFFGKDKREFRAKVFRASVDNSILYVPVRQTDACCGDLVMLCCQEETNTIIYAICIFRCIITCSGEFSPTRRVIALHVISTSLENTEIVRTFGKTIFDKFTTTLLSPNVSENVDIRISELSSQDDCSTRLQYGSCDITTVYERHIAFSNDFGVFVNGLYAHAVPVRHIEEYRIRRVFGLQHHLKTNKTIRYPIARTPHKSKSLTDFEHAMKLFEKFRHCVA